MHIDAIQHAIFLRQIGASEWKTRADRAGIHIAANLELVGHLRHGAIEPLLLLARRGFAVDELLTKHRFDRVVDKPELLETVRVNRHVQTKSEKSLRPHLQLVAKLFGVGERGFFRRVTRFAFFHHDAHVSLELRHFFAEVFEHDLCFDRVNKHANIDHLVDIDQAR